MGYEGSGLLYLGDYGKILKTTKVSRLVKTKCVVCSVITGPPTHEGPVLFCSLASVVVVFRRL